MTRWELDPERVRGVLHQVEDKRAELEDALAETRASALVLDVSGGGWPVAAVPRAIDGLLADQVERLTRIRQHIDAGIIGTGLAVAAYELGQHEMATSLQAAAVAAAQSGDLTAFQPYLEP